MYACIYLGTLKMFRIFLNFICKYKFYIKYTKFRKRPALPRKKRFSRYS